MPLEIKQLYHYSRISIIHFELLECLISKLLIDFKMVNINVGVFTINYAVLGLLTGAKRKNAALALECTAVILYNRMSSLFFKRYSTI